MFNKYFFIGALICIGGCSSIPEAPGLPFEVPDLPFMDMEPEEVEIASEIDPVAELKSRGDGYLSFTYNSGHLDRIMVTLKDDQIALSKGQTVVKKLPVGKYSFDVSGDQIYAESFSAELTYNGHTYQSIFDIPSRYSKIGFRSISANNLDHKLGLLVVGSALVDPLIEITKLDQPPHVLELNCVTNSDLKVGDILTEGKSKGNIAKVTRTIVVTGVTDQGELIYGTKSCGYSDNVTYTSPLRMSLPEGLYRMNASGEAKNVYVRGGTVNTIEITSKGFDGSTADWK